MFHRQSGFTCNLCLKRRCRPFPEADDPYGLAPCRNPPLRRHGNKSTNKFGVRPLFIHFLKIKQTVSEKARHRRERAGKECPQAEGGRRQSVRPPPVRPRCALGGCGFGGTREAARRGAARPDSFPPAGLARPSPPRCPPPPVPPERRAAGAAARPSDVGTDAPVARHGGRTTKRPPRTGLPRRIPEREVPLAFTSIENIPPRNRGGIPTQKLN